MVYWVAESAQKEAFLHKIIKCCKVYNSSVFKPCFLIFAPNFR